MRALGLGSPDILCARNSSVERLRFVALMLRLNDVLCLCLLPPASFHARVLQLPKGSWLRERTGRTVQGRGRARRGFDDGWNDYRARPSSESERDVIYRLISRRIKLGMTKCKHTNITFRREPGGLKTLVHP
jgi:hypothetical protein